MDEEEKAHLEQAKQAELDMASLEREALIRMALAVGIRFALPGAPTA